MVSARQSALTGREDALRVLREAAGNPAGTGSVVFVSGEAGIGKTRLLEAYLSGCRSAGDRVLIGGCVELLGDPLPYSPVAEALRELHAALAAGTGSLAAQVRDSLDRLLGIRPADAERGRPELFERILRLFVELIPAVVDGDSSRRPLLVVAMEDLHWADQATLDLLIFLARNLPGGHQLVLTCRSESAWSDRRLAALLTALRGRGLQRIELARLSRDQVAEIISRESDVAPTEGEVDRLFARSEGNPLIVEELIETQRRGGGMTRTLQELLLARTAGLGAATMQVVRLAAVVGRRVDHDTLAAACDLSEDDLFLALHEAVEAGVLSFDGEREEYVFRHVLTQDAVLTTLLPGLRRRLHGAVARAIGDQQLTRSSAGRAAEAASHWYAAGSSAQAFPAALHAGRLAAQVFAYDEAWRHLKHAMDLAGNQGMPDIPASDRAALLAEAAEAARWAGSLQDAVQLVRTAIELDADREVRGRRWERLGRYLWESGRATEAAEAYGSAADCLEGFRVSETAATVTASRANLLLITGQHSAAVPVARDAIRLAALAPAPLPGGRAEITLGMCLLFLGSPEEGASLVRRGHRVVEHFGDLDERRRAASNLSYALLMVGDTVAACDAALDGLALMRRYGLEAQAGAALTGNALVLLRIVGRWDEAERLSDEVLSRGVPDSQARYLQLARAGLEIARGRLDAAREHLDRAYPSDVLDQTHPLLLAELRSAEAELAMQRGALKDARGYVAEASAIVRLPEHGRIVIQLCRLGLQIEALIAEQNRSEKYPDLENEPRRETLHDILVSARDEAGSRESQAHLATAEAEYGRCLLTRDATAWISATSQWEALARPLDIAYCALRWAETELDSRGSAKGAAEPLRRGYRLAVELGAMTLVQQARQLARRGRIPLEDGPTAPPPAGPLMKRTEIERLRITPREYDVLCELVNGGSNQEIADRLYISNRTVAVHVSNLLGKLGVSRRGQAAAAANRLGLIDE